MPIYVKAHRRGKSVVKAYIRNQRLLYGKVAPTNHRQLVRQARQLQALLAAKYDVGSAILGRHRSGRSFAGSKLAKKLSYM